MDNAWSTHLHAKTRHIPILFYISFFIQHLAFTVSGTPPPPYNASENILLACGSSESFLSQDYVRSWIGDNGSPFFLKTDPENSASNVSDAPQQVSSIPDRVYSKARLSFSRLTYVFNLTAGQKFIRLYFYPTSYPNFHSSKAFFSVTAASFTLLRNFSASLTASALKQDTFFKEFCINVQEGERLNISFTPSQDCRNAYAFINGIEIVSMPDNLYYSKPGDSIKFVGQVNELSIENRNVLETVYRINIGGSFISPQDDTGMYRTWYPGITDYLTDTRPGALPFDPSLEPKFSSISNYTAPAQLYQTAMSMGLEKKINVYDNLTWEFPVDSGFKYFVRLHFCEFQMEITKRGDRVFEISIAKQTAEKQADVIGWTKEKGAPTYRDYAVAMGKKGNEKKRNLSLALYTSPQLRTKYSDVILNGIEIFKMDNNGYLAGPNPDPPMSPPAVPHPHPPPTKTKINFTTIIGIVAGVASGFIVISFLFLFSFRRARKAKDSGSATGFSSTPVSSRKTKSISKVCGPSEPSDNLYRHFSLVEIKAATNNFHDSLIIGVGGFGNVYKGWFLKNESTPVAIKRLNPGSQQGAPEFKTEIEMLSQLRHRHLVSLVGYCDDDDEMILVYDYMARGTLRDHLYNSDNPPLPWNQRLQICIGAARGLHHLHTGAKQIIIHRDVKTTNILLDEKWVAKVSDFGLSKIGATDLSQTHISTKVKGTFGYLDPNYFLLQQLTEKSDVYSFGVVLFEVLCARPPVLRTEDWKRASLAVWARECHNNGTFDQIVDPFLQGKIAPECLNQFAEVAISCLYEDRNRRPSMSEVVYGLEFALRQQIGKEKNDQVGEAHIHSNHLDDAMSVESYATDDSG